MIATIEDLELAGIVLTVRDLPSDAEVLVEQSECCSYVGIWQEHRGLATPLLGGSDEAGWISARSPTGRKVARMLAET